jgi:hypothetical protein
MDFLKKELSLLKKLTITDKNDVSLSQKQRRSLHSAMKWFLIQLLLKDYSAKRSRHLQILIIRRLIANMPAALYQYALALVSTGQCASAMVQLGRSIKNGHLPSRALKAWMLLRDREGVAKDYNGAFKLVEEGARLGCHTVKA